MLGVGRYARRAFEIVWSTHRGLTLAFLAGSILAGVLPAISAYFGKEIVDAVLSAAQHQSEVNFPDYLHAALFWVVVEGISVAALVATQSWLALSSALLRVRLGHAVNRTILEKALTLELAHFENAEFYDKLTRARREASSRPLSLVSRTFGLVQALISVSVSAALLWKFSPWIVVLVAFAGLPSFVVEARLAQDAFRLFRFRSPESRMQIYLEGLLAREDYAKEVKIYGLGPLFLRRYQAIFDKIYGEDKALTLRRNVWAMALGLVATALFYGLYAWVVYEAAWGRLGLGDMTLNLLLLRQVQQSVATALAAVSRMYEDNLYLSTLDEYLAQEASDDDGAQKVGASPGTGLRFEAVSFRYPGTERDVLEDISFEIRPGQVLALVGENGSGKTTLIKLLARLYRPTKGIIYLDETPLDQWEHAALLARLSVVFQDFTSYQFTVGENIGAGDVARFEDRDAWQSAAAKGLAAPFIDTMAKRYDTQLGKWFRDGVELSGGQWQKIALSRAFMREGSDIVVLDEPTAAMDAAAEVEVFDYVRASAATKMVVLISHRFSTVRAADRILVMNRGRVVESGTHEELLVLDGIYARLFNLQAAGYR
jgi:ATP-binding cassette subfamily B protein